MYGAAVLDKRIEVERSIATMALGSPVRAAAALRRYKALPNTFLSLDVAAVVSAVLVWDLWRSRGRFVPPAGMAGDALDAWRQSLLYHAVAAAMADRTPPEDTWSHDRLVQAIAGGAADYDDGFFAAMVDVILGCNKEAA